MPEIQALEKLSPLGQHLKRRQFALRISQNEVAKILNVEPETITNWYYGRTFPEITDYAKIIAFLGYDPFPEDITTVSGMIKHFRKIKGMTFRQLATLTGFDEGSLRD